MADSTGFSALSPAEMREDFAHVQQSVRIILTTRIGTRVMRRDFGSAIPDLIDRRMTQANVLLFYAAAADALQRWEPRFSLRKAAIESLSVQGQIELRLEGIYYPRGHRGDWSVTQSRDVTVTFGVQGGRA